MRTLIILVLLPTLATAQPSVRSCYDTFSSAGPLLDRASPLANGDILYYDQAWGGIARIAPNDAIVWYERIDVSGTPLEPTTVAHAAEQSNGNIVLATVNRMSNGQYRPGLVILDENGDMVSASVAQALTISIAEYMQVVVLLGSDEIRMTIRDTGNNGSFHAFDAMGVHLSSLGFSANSDMPVELLAYGQELIGANVGRLVSYDTNGAPNWALTPATTTIGSESYFAFIWDVVPIPIGYAFAFIRSGGPSLMMPGIGLVSSTGIFQGAIVFEVTELQGINNIWSRLHLASTINGLTMIGNNGSSTDPTGYIFSCDNSLANTQVLKVELGTGSYPNSISNTATFGVVMTGHVQSPNIGERLIARTQFGSDMSSCFPAVAFTPVAFPMASSPFVPFSGAAMTANWTPVIGTAQDGTFTSDYLCGVQAITEAGVEDGTLAFPNPTHDQLNIRWPLQEALEVHVFDAMGKEVHQWTLASSGHSLDMRVLASGLYSLLIAGERSGERRTVAIAKE